MGSLLTAFLLFLGLLGVAMGDNNQTHVPPNVPPKAADKPAKKPVTHPELNANLSPALFEHLPPTWGSWKGWASGWIPKPCREAAEKHHLNPWEMEVYSVKYTDCDEPWTICRHYKDSISIAKMAETFGNIPIGMREYFGTIVTLPDLGGPVGLTYLEAGLPVIQFLYGWFIESVLIHEISHVLDTQIPNEYGHGRFSNTSVWKGNYSLDAAAVTRYSLTNWSENFAEASIAALYDLVVPGGLANVTADAKSVSHVVSTYKHALGDIIKPRSKPKCTKRWRNAEIVPVSDKRVPPYPPLDVSIKSSSVTQMENASKGTIMNCTLPH
ncbi:hypothetical protein PG985_002249 [Apiospora marii]|uniref:Conidiation-specific protein 13 n=1 Tax=Apiospora marii TaxID=335849 RepID=A0ABR1RZH4_9PEZI